jgi:RNA binding exosome subunit
VTFGNGHRNTITRNTSLPYDTSHSVKREIVEISTEAFVNATEDEGKVLQILENLLGSRELYDMERSTAEGYHGNPIIILKTHIRRNRDIRNIMARFREMDFWKTVIDQIDIRLDDTLHLNFRLDKERAYAGEYALWDGGESIQVRIKFTTYPSSRERAMEIIRSMR